MCVNFLAFPQWRWFIDFSAENFGCFSSTFRSIFCFLKDVFADCSSVEKKQGMFYLLKIAFQRSSSGTVPPPPKKKKNSPKWCFWGPSGYHQMNPSSCCANQASGAIYSWHLNSWLVIMDWLRLSPPKALQFRFLLILWLFFFLFCDLSLPSCHWSRKNDQPWQKYCWSAFDFQIAK